MSTFVNNDVASGNVIYAADHNEQGARLAAVLNGNIDSSNIHDGSITLSKLASDVLQNVGWAGLGIAQSGTIVHNGNRSYDVPFASSVAAILSPGMRLLLDKTVAGNAYMGGAFNGTSHYFTKVSPTGALASVTNNVTFVGVYDPTAYAAGYIVCRGDAGGNNILGVQVNTAGQLAIAVANGGAANYRVVVSYQSLPSNKRTPWAVTWSSGTVTMYFDGVSIPVQTAVTGGTAPTTAGTGGDFSIGRAGAANTLYAPGYISNVAVFDAVLSAATIKQYSTYKLLGNEPNCIFSCTLDNTTIDNSTAGNNLTAQNGVGFTAMSPHGQLGDGVQASKAVGLVMAVNGSTVTVQCPEGVTIPTTGGITSVSYATSGNPFGWVSDKGRWSVISYHSAANTQNAPTNSLWYNIGNHQLYVPVGSWIASIEGGGYCTDNATALITIAVTLSKTNSTNDNNLFLASSSVNATAGAASNINLEMSFSRTSDITNVAATTYYLNYSGSSTAAPLLDMQTRSNIIKALPAGL